MDFTPEEVTEELENQKKTFKMIDFAGIEDDSSQLKRLIDEGKIFTVEMYECPVSNSVVAGWFFKHRFVIFETKKWWWSVEKNDEGITIQRSKNKDNVKSMFEP